MARVGTEVAATCSLQFCVRASADAQRLRTGKRVRIPRCRATVSESRANAEQSHRLRYRRPLCTCNPHGKAAGPESTGLRTCSPSQETGANADKNLFRVKRRIVMRTIRALFLLVLVSAVLVFQVSASEIKIQIVDPHSALVGSARVTLYGQAQDSPLAVRSASCQRSRRIPRLAAGALPRGGACARFRPGRRRRSRSSRRPR